MSGPIRIQADCRTCGEGDLIYSRRTQDGVIFAECLECLTGYDVEFDTNLSAGVRLGEVWRLEEADWDWEPANPEEVQSARESAL